MKSLKEQLLNEERVNAIGDSFVDIKLSKNTTVFAVYSTTGDDLFIWSPTDIDELAELLMRNFEYDYDAKEDAEQMLKLESGKTLAMRITPKKGTKTKINFTCIK